MIDAHSIADARARDFLLAEDGAVSADFMALSAIVIALAVFVVGAMVGGTEGIGDKIAGSLDTAEIDEVIID